MNAFSFGLVHLLHHGISRELPILGVWALKVLQGRQCLSSIVIIGIQSDGFFELRFRIADAVRAAVEKGQILM